MATKTTIDYQEAESRERRERIRAQQFFGRWQSMKGEITPDQLERVLVAFNSHIKGFTSAQVDSYVKAAGEAYKVLLKANPDGFSLTGANKEFFDKFVEDRMGGAIPPRNDFKAFWDEVHRALPSAMTDEDKRFLVSDGMRSAQWLLLGLLASPAPSEGSKRLERK